MNDFLSSMREYCVTHQMRRHGTTCHFLRSKHYVKTKITCKNTTRCSICMFAPLGSPKRNDFIIIFSHAQPTVIIVLLVEYIKKKNNSFYSRMKEGLLETLNEIFGANILPQSSTNDRHRVCKGCFRCSEVIVSKRKVFKELEREFQGKYASVSHASSTKSLAKDSPHIRESKKMRPEMKKEIHAWRVSLFSDKSSQSTTIEDIDTFYHKCYEMEKENIPVMHIVLQLQPIPQPQANVNEMKL